MALGTWGFPGVCQGRPSAILNSIGLDTAQLLAPRGLYVLFYTTLSSRCSCVVLPFDLIVWLQIQPLWFESNLLVIFVVRACE